MFSWSTVKRMKEEGPITKNLEIEMKLLKRHLTMLKTIAQEEPIGIINLSELMGIPQHKVRYSLRILENEGVIKPTSKGAVISMDKREFIQKMEKTLTGLCEDSEEMLDIVRSV